MNIIKKCPHCGNKNLTHEKINRYTMFVVCFCWKPGIVIGCYDIKKPKRLKLKVKEG